MKSKQKAHGNMTIVNQEKAMMFQVQTTSRMIDELQREWNNPVQTATDDKLIAWRDYPPPNWTKSPRSIKNC